jgi:hypothetical protein
VQRRSIRSTVDRKRAQQPAAARAAAAPIDMVLVSQLPRAETAARSTGITGAGMIDARLNIGAQVSRQAGGRLPRRAPDDLMVFAAKAAKPTPNLRRG